MAKTVIYSFDITGDAKFDGGPDEFEFDGVYALKDLGIIFVESSKVSKISEQPKESKLTEVKDMKIVAAIACCLGWSEVPTPCNAEKLAVLKDYGYDLIKEYTDIAGIQAKALEYLEA